MYSRNDRFGYGRQPGKDTQALHEENKRLKDAIRKHRDQKGDDRCWMDDDELYKVLDEPLFERPMPSREKMLENCKRFIELRTKPTAETDDTSISGRWMSRAELENVEKMRTALKTALKELDDIREDVRKIVNKMKDDMIKGVL